ncbi:low molecular weight protein-tyrosine-phosphatase [Cellulomonas edaphi]|uniref:protein-tyrosine-phosphatase n=1 Tax=Cellulomonas edaphi TaxID=3053468 RepID=A0ABT7S3K9_9CELL|nr:low molecular weight protein-tyrosine-phosphatase [Cellulomons edaphi]MDM7830208.1 low molecular weight protein-tyrosine-phosphatase [Cellulomons edaphi]
MLSRVTYRVMTVCTGNICRSPMAEVVLRARFEAAGLDVEVDSTGISDEERGNPIDRRARAVLVAHGYDPAGSHRARRFSPADLPARDLVLAMTAAHARALRRAADPEVAERVVMYRQFDPAADPDDLDVDDPWYGGPEDFEVCLAQLEAAADGVVEHVRAATA